MTEKMSKQLREYIDTSRRSLREVMRSAYGYARIAALVGTIVFVGFYVLNLAHCGELARAQGNGAAALTLVPEGLLWSYLIILGVFEFFKIVKRMTDKSCTFSLSERSECGDEPRTRGKHRGEDDPFSVWLAFKIWPFHGLNKFICFVWSALAIGYQIVYGYQMYAYGQVFVPEPDTFWKVFLGVVAICSLGLLNNAVFIFRTPGFKNFWETVAHIALRKGDVAQDTLQKTLEELMWRKRQEWKPLDEERCKKCVGGLSREIAVEFPELGDLDDETRKDLCDLLLKNGERDGQVSTRIAALAASLCALKK